MAPQNEWATGLENKIIRWQQYEEQGQQFYKLEGTPKVLMRHELKLTDKLRNPNTKCLNCLPRGFHGSSFCKGLGCIKGVIGEVIPRVCMLRV